jgi:hypothetical protein
MFLDIAVPVQMKISNIETAKDEEWICKKNQHMN